MTQPEPTWVTVKACPAMVKEPCRGLEEALAVKEKTTVPLPEPLEPEVIESQESLLTAVHGQDEADEETAIWAAAADEETVREAGLRVKEQAEMPS